MDEVDVNAKKAARGQQGTNAPVSLSDRSQAWYTNAREKDWYILRELVSKDFKLKYRRSALGVAWSVLNPLLMMIVMSAVFSSFMRFNDPSLGNFPCYLILGTTAFQLMADATSTGMGSIIGASALLKKVKINRYVFPVEKVLFAGVNYGFSLIAVALVMVFFRVPVTPLILLLPVAVFLLLVFCVGLSLLLSAASVFFRDVIHLWSVVITAWTYATPIFYSANILPGWMATFEKFNPMYLYITFIREVTMWSTMPSPKLILACCGFAFGALLVGWLVFRKNEHKFILFI